MWFFVSGDLGSYCLCSVDGYSLLMFKVYFDQMGMVQVICQSFFVENLVELQVCFCLEFYIFDFGVSCVEFCFDGQFMEYCYGLIVLMLFKWFSDVDGGCISLVLEKMVG